MVAEVVAGIVGSSLALLSDAGHMLTDAVALGLALAALRLAERPPAGSFTYGMRRAEILSAQVNGITLLLLGGLIIYEGIRRLIDPPDVEGGLVLVVALVGIAVNLIAARMLAGAERRSLNVEGAFLHVVTDLFAFVATAIAGALILIWGFERADGIASLLIAALMLWAAYGLLRESGRVFMEAAPPGLDPEAIGKALVANAGVVEVHDLHVWEVTTGHARDLGPHDRRAATPTATRPAGAPPACSPTASGWSTPPSRSSTSRATSCCRSKGTSSIRATGRPGARRTLAPGLEPGEDEAADADDRRGEAVLEVDVRRAGLVAREERGQRAGVVDPVDRGDHEEDDPEDDRRE